MSLYKEDWEKLKKNIENENKNMERTREVNLVMLNAIEKVMRNAKVDPNIIDVGVAKVKVPDDKKPSGVG